MVSTWTNFASMTPQGMCVKLRSRSRAQARSRSGGLRSAVAHEKRMGVCNAPFIGHPWTRANRSIAHPCDSRVGRSAAHRLDHGAADSDPPLPMKSQWVNAMPLSLATHGRGESEYRPSLRLTRGPFLPNLTRTALPRAARTRGPQSDANSRRRQKTKHPASVWKPGALVRYWQRLLRA